MAELRNKDWRVKKGLILFSFKYVHRDDISVKIVLDIVISFRCATDISGINNVSIASA